MSNGSFISSQNSIIWRGGGLKRCEHTSEDDAKANMQLADDIVDNPIVNKWYGIYPIGDHGGFDQSCQNASSQEVVTGTKLICL